MKSIYENIAKQLSEKIPELAWIDLDNGQLDYAEYRAAVDFPAVLISIDYPQCEDIGLNGIQQCIASITLRLVMQVFDETNLSAPEDVRARGMAIYDLVNKIQETLQWRMPNENTGILSRRSVIREKRDDGLAVVTIIYNTTVTDTKHYCPDVSYVTVSPVIITD